MLSSTGCWHKYHMMSLSVTIISCVYCRVDAGVGGQQPPQRGLPVPAGGQARVPQDGEDPRHGKNILQSTKNISMANIWPGLDIRWELLQRHDQPGPVRPRGAGRRQQRDGGVRAVQGRQPRLPLPGGTHRPALILGRRQYCGECFK